MKLWDLYLKAVIVEGVAVLIIILSVLTVKYCFKSTYAKLNDWYNQSILTDTDISEVIKGEV